nr:MAG TPA: hypothetical protein [Caudoviricetes sp.]
MGVLFIWEESMKHYLTIYEENGKRYAETWFQINLFSRCFCFLRERVEL